MAGPGAACAALGPFSVRERGICLLSRTGAAGGMLSSVRTSVRTRAAALCLHKKDIVTSEYRHGKDPDAILLSDIGKQVNKCARCMILTEM